MAKVTKRPHAALDIGFHDDPKVLDAGNAAIGLYTRALAYCADKLTDGLVPEAWVRKEGTPAERKRLLELGFLTKTEDGYLIPNYLKYNLSRAEVEEQSEYYRNLVNRRWHKGNEPEPAAEQPASPDTERHTHRITGGSTQESLSVLPDSDSNSDLENLGGKPPKKPKKLERLITELDAIGKPPGEFADTGWRGVADAYAYREFGHGIAVLTIGQHKQICVALTEYLEGQKA